MKKNQGRIKSAPLCKPSNVKIRKKGISACICHQNSGVMWSKMQFSDGVLYPQCMYLLELSLIFMLSQTDNIGKLKSYFQK